MFAAPITSCRCPKAISIGCAAKALLLAVYWTQLRYAVNVLDLFLNGLADLSCRLHLIIFGYSKWHGGSSIMIVLSTLLQTWKQDQGTFYATWYLFEGSSSDVKGTTWHMLSYVCMNVNHGGHRLSAYVYACIYIYIHCAVYGFCKSCRATDKKACTWRVVGAVQYHMWCME